MAVEALPLNNGRENTAATQYFTDCYAKGNSGAVLSVRLAQEHPKHYEAYMRGEFKSVTAAAIVWDDGLWPVEFTAKAPASLFAKRPSSS